MARNVVATSQPLASQAGVRMLHKGGNAVDAAIAAAAALTVVEPISNGLGSDAFAIVWDGTRLHGLNSSGAAPATWTPDYFARKHGGQVPVRGWDAVTVPGAVAGWVDAVRALRQAAVRRPDGTGRSTRRARPRRSASSSTTNGRGRCRCCRTSPVSPGLHAAGRAPAPGERFVFAAPARRCAGSARRTARPTTAARSPSSWSPHAKANGGSLSLADLAGFRPSGWTRSRRTSPATRCTRSRRTGRASPR